MSKYRLNVVEFWKAAARRGDRAQLDVVRRTGLDKSVVSRLVNGRKLSLDPLMCLSETYGVSANRLSQPIADTLDDEAAA